MQLSPPDSTSKPPAALTEPAGACQSSAQASAGAGGEEAGLPAAGGTAHEPAQDVGPSDSRASAPVAPAPPTPATPPEPAPAAQASHQLTPQEQFELEFGAYDAQTQALLIMLHHYAQPSSPRGREELLQFRRSLLPPTHPAAAQGGMSAKAVARLQQRLDRLIAEGEVFAAVPLQSQLAAWVVQSKGPDHADSLQAVHTLSQLQHQQNTIDPYIYMWLMPRAASQWGIGHPDTRQLVQQATRLLWHYDDPRKHTNITQAVTDIAQQLPGGLGWGSLVVAPVPDQESYDRTVVMHNKAGDLFSQGHYKLAQTMYERCVVAYEQLGQHWLATPRKLECLMLIGGCMQMQGDWAAAEAHFLSSKRLAQRELGQDHPVTLKLGSRQADFLLKYKRHEQALSVCQKLIRLSQTTLGPRHCRVLQVQVSWPSQLSCQCARVCMLVGSLV